MQGLRLEAHRGLSHDTHGNDQFERLAALYNQALDAINQACRIVDASWEQQVGILPFL